MDSLPREILAEKENVEQALGHLREALSRPEKSVIELSAIATFLHNIYNGVENILKQTLKIKGIAVRRSGAWHKELLVVSVAQRVISKDMADKLYEYLSFRHFFVHSYAFVLQEATLKELATSIAEVWSTFISEIEMFLGKDSSRTNRKGNRRKE